MKRVILVAGTHSWDPHDPKLDWHEPGSEFVKFLQAQGVSLVFADGRPFTWSTNLGGVGFGDGDLRIWHAAGFNLYCYIVPPLCPEKRIPASETVVLAHSHGMQVALFAFALGLKGTLVSVGAPVRRDMQAIAKQAQPNIQRWLHLYNDRTDFWQVAGALFDGRISIVRKHPLADRNDSMRGGHSDVLRDPKLFHLWVERGWLEWLKQTPEQKAA